MCIMVATAVASAVVWTGASLTKPTSNNADSIADSLLSTAATWDDAKVDAWNQYLYQSSLQRMDTTTTVDGGGRYLKSEAKKKAHAEKKMQKKQAKMNEKGTSVSNELIYLNHTSAFRTIRHGNDMLSSSEDFFHYQNGWEAQINQAYCAVATSAAALNSLRGVIELPQDPIYVPFPWATQLTLVKDACVDLAVHDPTAVRYAGLGLGMVPSLLNCYLEPQGFVATGHPMDPAAATVDEVRSLVKGALMEEDSRVLLNYDRGGIGQGPMGHGHWSPIGAYDAATDSFLVMDVAKYKYPPVFVPTEALLHGAATLDTCSTMGEHPTPVDFTSHDFQKLSHDLACQPGFRGFVVIKRK